MLDWLTVGFVRILSVILQLLPHEVALALGRFVGFCLSKANDRRRVAYVNLKAAFPGRFSPAERKKIVKKHFIYLAQNIVEIFRFPKLNQIYLERYIQVEHRDRYERHVQRGQGTVLITPHFGNWELTQILSGLVGKPMYVLAREQKHSRLNDYLNDLRASHGSVTIQKGGGVRELIRELRKGGFVGVLGDLSGGRSGIVVKFFGRKTTAPPGIFEIASRTNSTILPCFMVRTGKTHHQVFIEEPFECLRTPKGEFDLQATVQNYYRLLEHWISDYPDQWLWIYKRWKYCFTKKILILKDAQAGHANQSEAIAKEFERLRGSLPQEYELDFQSIMVHFKSAWHRRLFFLFAFFALPFAQGRLSFFNFFFESECAQKLQNTYADLIVSSGSGLAPLNLLLKKENLGKSIVVMKPSFPFRSQLFDLLIIPLHDAFPKHKRGVVRTLITPSCVDRDLLQMSGGQLAERVSLTPNGKKRISVFIGGNAKSYRLERRAFHKWIQELKGCAEQFNFELLVTTSR
ncbi:MAG: mitochondrial fission ELM1 family protein, partial [Candidatus Omnitrophica bacterium]|nr:mitochondrial fission ELM1 family protein [Candidatus Omnitrophota bacterium]